MRKERIGVIGAGLCGTLLGIRLSQLGYRVDIWERRSDMRQSDVDAGRSINLALSSRGLSALDMIGLHSQILDDIIPMYGRRIHDVDGNTTLYKYSGREDEYINSVSRSGLNIELLNYADDIDGLNIHFSTQVDRVDLDNTSLYVRDGEDVFKHQYDIIFGADGAGSAVRRSIQKRSNQLRFDFSQKYLDTGYKELEIPAGEGGTWRIDRNALHIWPRDGHMMIALPNTDGSFTLTLFIRFEGEYSLEHIKDDEAVQAFFEQYYPDALAHMPTLIRDWHDNPTSSLGMIKCHPWLVNHTLLIGDAAHAIVPFCALEDCVVLDRLIAQHDHDWSTILPQYQSIRKPHTDAIADLAIDNFYEMRDATADPLFNKKRKLELRLETEYPDYYSKYGLVTFRPDLDYHQAMTLGRRQDDLLMDLAASIDDPKAANLSAIYDQVMALGRQ
jgi:kynurenine 3-monooxygenase